METSKKVFKCGDDVVQSYYLIPGEEGPADSLDNTKSNAVGVSDLSAMSLKTPRQDKETSMLLGNSKNKDGAEEGVKRNMKEETGKTASVLTTPQPTTICGTTMTSEREKTQGSKMESVEILNSKQQTSLSTEPATKTSSIRPKMLINRNNDCRTEVKQDTSSRFEHQKSDSQMASQTSTKVRIQQIEQGGVKSNEKTRHHSRPRYSKTHCLGWVSTQTSEPSSRSPKAPSQRKSAVTGNHSTSRSKDSLDSKYSNVGLGSSTCFRSNSNSKPGTGNEDSLDLNASPGSKASPSSENAVPPKESLNYKHVSVSKISCGSKDILNFNTDSNFKASPHCKSGMGIGSKTATKIKVTKTNPDLRTSGTSKSGIRSEVALDGETLPDFKAGVDVKTSPNLNLGSYNSIPASTHFPSSPSLMGAGSRIGSVLPSSSRTCLSRAKDDNIRIRKSSAKVTLVLRDGSDSSKPRPVLASSKSALADSSSSLMLSPQQCSAKKSPGPGKGLGSLGPNKEVQPSPRSTSGSGRLTTSSLKTKTTFGLTMGVGSTLELTTAASSLAGDAKTCMAPHNTSLTQNLTFESITKTSAKPGIADEKEHAEIGETNVAAAGGVVVSQKCVQRVDMINTALQLPGNILSTSGQRKNEEMERQERGEENLFPLPSSHPVSLRTVRDTATMTDLSERLHQKRDVGIQVQVDEHLSFQRGQLDSLTSTMIPSLCSFPTGQPSFQHICKIDIELHSQKVLSSTITDNASFLPAFLRTYNFQQIPVFGQNHNISSESLQEDKEEEKANSTVENEQKEEREEVQATLKPQEVAWDKYGMTWEVYGASVDMDCLGSAIQSHLESKILEQKKHISSLRKSICSNNSLKGGLMKKRKRRGCFLRCCRKEPAVAN